MLLKLELAEAAFKRLETKLSFAQRVQYAWQMGGIDHEATKRLRASLSQTGDKRGATPR